ncbi:MAG: hypothetical protein ABEJ81_00575 [Haloferacaceae archaeon]
MAPDDDAVLAALGPYRRQRVRLRLAALRALGVIPSPSRTRSSE